MGECMELAEIIHCIEGIAPLDAAAPWDNSGVQVACTRKNISRLAVMLEPTHSALQKALDAGSEMVLAHHPLSMQPRYPNTLGEYHACLSLLFSRNVLLYSAHTSLDANLCGPPAWLADALDLHDRAALEVTAPRPGSPLPFGFGLVGKLPSPMVYGEFIRLLGGLLGKTHWNATGPLPELVTTVAYCPGSGASMMDAAFNSGADIYITGDVKYHAALEAKLRVLDVGHATLEESMMRKTADVLREQCAGVAVTFFPSSDPLVLEYAVRPGGGTYTL